MAGTWLILETSGRVSQAGLACGEGIVRSWRLEEPRRLARDLAGAVRTMLDAEGLQPADLVGVMVGIGPGSYTGLRVGIASAKALAYAAGCRLIAVPTFAAIALQAPAEAAELWVVADGLQGMAYVQRFGAAPKREPRDGLRIAPAADVLPLAPAGAWFTGPGAAPHASWIPDHCPRVSEADREPTLLSTYRAGLALPPLTREELFALEPLYLRGSSAEEKANNR